MSRRNLFAKSCRGRWTRWLAAGCGGVVVVLIVVVAVAYYMLTTEPPEFREVVARRAPRTSAPASSAAPSSSQPTSAAPASSSEPAPGPSQSPPMSQGASAAPAPASQPQVPPVKEQIESIRQAMRQGYRGPVRVVATEAEIARELQKALSEINATDVGAKVTANEVILSARVNFAGVRAPVVIRLQPQVQSGAPRLVITKATIGRVALPEDRVEQIQKKLDEKLTAPVVKSGAVRVRNISLQPGMVVIDGDVGQRRQ